MTRVITIVTLLLVSFLTPPANALITGGLGNDPVPDAGWPRGCVEVANLKTRVAYWEGPPFGGGQYQFLYRGDTDAFNAALDAFSKVRTPVRELIVHDGPQDGFYIKIHAKDDPKLDPRIDWSFTVWVPANWHRLYNTPTSAALARDPNYGRQMDPPRMEVYIGGAGKIDWAKVKLPANVRVIDKRAATSGVKIEGGAVIHVNVYDMATGKPVEGAKLRITESKRNGADVAVANGDADGLAKAEKIPAGVHRVMVEAPGYAPRIIAYDEFKTTMFRSYDTELSKSATVQGTVIDSEGKPVADATVRANTIGIDGRGYNVGEKVETKTDAQGRFEIADLPTGHLQLSAYAKGHHQLEFQKMFAAPSKDITLRMAATGKIQGKVIGKDGKAPPKGTQVHIMPEGGNVVGTWGGSGAVKEDGSFEFAQVPPGKYLISTTATFGNERAKDAIEFTVTAGKTVEVNVPMK